MQPNVFYVDVELDRWTFCCNLHGIDVLFSKAFVLGPEIWRRQTILMSLRISEKPKQICFGIKFLHLNLIRRKQYFHSHPDWLVIIFGRKNIPTEY